MRDQPINTFGRQVVQPLLAAAAIVVGAFLVYIWIRRNSEKTDRGFRNQVIKDAADWMAKTTGATSESLFEALINEQRDDPLLAPLLRIDCEILKTSPDKCNRTVVVAIKDAGKVVIGNITREVPWEYLPDEVCSEFIKTGEKTQSFIFVEKRVQISVQAEQLD